MGKLWNLRGIHGRQIGFGGLLIRKAGVHILGQGQDSLF